MTILLWFIAGYLVIGVLLGVVASGFVDHPVINEGKLTANQILLVSTFGWLPLLIIGMFFGKHMEESK